MKEMSCGRLLMLILTGNHQFSERPARFLSQSQLNRIHTSCYFSFSMNLAAKKNY